MTHIHRRNPQNLINPSCPTGKQYWDCTATPTEFHGCCIGNPCHNSGICPDKDGPSGEPLTTTIARSKTSTSSSATTATAQTAPAGSNTNSPEEPLPINPSSTSAPAPPPGSPNNLGAIVGGCMGGLALLLALGALFYLIRLRRRENHGANAPTASSSSAAAAMDPSKPPLDTPPAPWQSPAPQYSSPLASPGFADKSFLREQQQQHTYAELPAPYAGPAELGGGGTAASSSPFLSPDASTRGSGDGDGGGSGGHQWSK